MSVVTRGQKRHLVTLQGPTRVLDPDLGWIDTYTDLTPATRYASIIPATARDLERMTAGTVQSTASHIVTIDFHPGVNTQTRVVFGSRHLAVVGVANPEERNIEQILACTEVVE